MKRRALLCVPLVIAVLLVLVAYLGDRKERQPEPPAGAATRLPPDGAAAQVRGDAPARPAPAGARASVASSHEGPPNVAPVVPAPAVVRVTVEDSEGAPVAARVELRSVKGRDRVVATVDVDASGVGEVSGNFEGEFVPHVVAASLPPGHLPPWAQDKPTSHGSHGGPGFSSRKYAAPTTGETLEIELRVFRSSTVSGYVLGPDGRGVTDGDVRIVSRWSGVQIGPYVPLDADGFFELNDVYPGPYRAQVLVRLDHPLGRAPRPMPVDFEVPPATHVPLTLRLGVPAGTAVVRGRLLFDDGEPAAGINVACIPWTRDGEWVRGEQSYGRADRLVVASAGGDGSFELSGLPHRPIRVTPGYANYSFSDRWNGELGELPPGVDVDLTSATAPVTLAPIVVVRNRGYRFIGRIELEPGWAAAHSIRYPTGLEVWLQRDGEKDERLRVSHGEFRWGTMQPHGTAKVLVREPRSGTTKTLELVPRASADEAQTIDFP